MFKFKFPETIANVILSVGFAMALTGIVGEVEINGIKLGTTNYLARTTLGLLGGSFISLVIVSYMQVEKRPGKDIGNISLLKKHTGWRKSWSLIVPGKFGGSGSTDLLFYDSSKG